MKLKSLALALALCAGAPAMAATCTSSFSLGTLGPSSGSFFGNDFNSAQSFNDCYTFTLSQAPTSATTTTIEWDWSSRLNIDLTSVTLSGGNLVSYINNLWSESWTFTGLTAGDYMLEVSGNVTDTHSGYGGVGYIGMLTTSGVVTPVPEPQTLAMLALGLGAVVWGGRRKSS
ncbi:FxDxF family PEP-CTERM protein [Piscinibacter sp. XHJ-5]|uniref:FxDxF family PEP-CTERM protein n=1 Tax=Piscinibacter sp. XHJ-5 TaxID=3037797 RepID=UPI0024536B8A|nr:FxDxF family PEP-CTERM protein [Piscinibacter sp. XHJ-5]